MLEFEPHGTGLPALIAAFAAVTAALWGWRLRPQVLNPLAYAFAFTLAAAVLFHGLVTSMSWMALHGSPLPGAVALALALITLVATLNNGFKSLSSPWIIGLALITLPLAWTGEMGVLTAMLLAAAAFGWGDRLMSVFAWSFLAGFLFLFYYQMHIPLSWKAAVIGGSGLVFLVLRAVLVRVQAPALRA
jgi:hypothetical protein